MNKICEYCGEEHDGSYGSGRFCSKKCQSRYCSVTRITLDKLNSGQCPDCSSIKIKNFLLRNNIKQNICEQCGISEWHGKELIIQLHHIDGNRRNNCLSNLIMLCPNCHSLTDTYGFTGKKYS